MSRLDSPKARNQTTTTTALEGELVWIQEPCGRDRNDPDGPLVRAVRLAG